MQWYSSRNALCQKADNLQSPLPGVLVSLCEKPILAIPRSWDFGTRERTMLAEESEATEDQIIKI